MIIAFCDNAKCWFAALAQKTGEDSHEIRRRGFMLAGSEDSGPDLDPECLLDLIDLPEAGTVDWDTLGFGCREPFYQFAREDLCGKTTSLILPRSVDPLSTSLDRC
jgi:hypothetical protein